MTRQCTFMLLSTLALLGVPASTHANQGPSAGEERRPTPTAKGELVHQAVETTPEIRHDGGTARGADCNNNGTPDVQDTADGTSLDCNGNEVPDECEVVIRYDYSFLLDLPEPVLDGVTISRTFSVPDDDMIADVDLGLTLTHEFLGDLIITLTHAGTSVNVYYYGPCQACAGTCGFGGTVFDDEADDALPCVDLNEGRFLPVEALSAFNGMNAQGDWTLEIFDGFIGYEGSLDAWSLSIASRLADCNLNAIPDDCDIADGTSDDCNTNAIPDECDIVSGGGSSDCNDNGIPDDCDVIGDDIDQWASTVLGFSSQYNPSPMSYSAFQALGPPDTFVYCDCGSAWAPSSNDGTLEFISVGFDQRVFADGVTIRETQGNGFVTRVELIDALGGVHIAWEGVDPSEIGVPVDYRIDWPRTEFLVTGVTIYTDTNLQLNTWEEIDAVQLHGAPANNDCNGNATPDECEIAAGSTDCNANGIPDDCDIAPLGPMITQWASEVIEFSSEFENPEGNRLAVQALGMPDGIPWAPSPTDGSLEFITVGYLQLAYATGITIREFSGQGMVYQVDVLDTNGVLHTVWEGVDPTPLGITAVDFDVSWPMTSFAVKGVKVYVDTDHAPLVFEQVDAIELHGRAASDCNSNGLVDWCEFGTTDCNANGTPDYGDINPPHHNCCEVGGCNDETVYECVSQTWPHCREGWDQICTDAVEGLGCGTCQPIDVDCNANGIPDDCDIAPLGSMIDQWASEVIDFSSEGMGIGGDAANALGEPDEGVSWSPFSVDGPPEFLTVGFATPVYAAGVTIREQMSPGFVLQVDVVDMNDALHMVWQGVDPGGPCCGVDVELTWSITAFEVKGVKVYVDILTGLETRETIDAIQLHGLAGTDCNNNGTNDWCEFDSGDCNGNGVPDACEVGDFNGDSAIDLLDHLIFTQCFEGPEVIVDPDCEAGDFDCDGDVDLRDWAQMQNLLE